MTIKILRYFPFSFAQQQQQQYPPLASAKVKALPTSTPCSQQPQSSPTVKSAHVKPFQSSANNDHVMTNSNAEGSTSSSVATSSSISSSSAVSPSQTVAGADSVPTTAPTVAAIVAASRPAAKHDDKSKAASPVNGKLRTIYDQYAGGSIFRRKDRIADNGISHCGMCMIMVGFKYTAL